MTRQIEVDFPENPSQSFLAYVRKSTPDEQAFTVGWQVGHLYGAPRSSLGSERALVQYLLDIANGRTKPPLARASLEGGGTLLGTLAPAEALKIHTEDTRKARLEHQAFLARVIDDRVAAAEQFLKSDARVLNRVPVLFDIHRGRGIELRPHAFLMQLATFDAYAYALLLDESKPFGSNLRRCKLSTCGRFFLVPPRKPGAAGRPNEHYCPGTDHRGRAHDAGASDRQRATRTRKSAIALLSRGEGVVVDVELVRQVYKQYPESTPQQLAERVAALKSPRRHK